MPTVETEDDSEAPESDGGTAAAATPSTTASSARSAKNTRTVGTMTDDGRTPHFARVKSERTSTTESESEEARVARRRERWRLKKREQRAKMAARLSETQEKVTPVITASAHFLFPHADRGGQAQTQTLRKSTQIAKERPPNGAPPSSLPRRGSSEAQRRQKVKCLSVPLPPLPRRSIPPTDAAGDSLEQTVAKQREYWRIKKREQRAKMSMEAKVRLKEKDSLMRRVRRYRNIVKEMRRARAWEGTIGSFIPEDGTLSATGVPRTTASLGGMAGKGGRAVPAGAPPRSSEPPPPRSCSHLARPQSQRKAVFPAAAARVARPACVRKMLLSDQSLSEAERSAKKREYWRVTKRQQRAARLRREGARLGPPLQRKRGPRPVSEAPVLNAIKREPDLRPASERGVAPDVEPLEPEPDPASSADCPAATTLLAVASMKKLLEESLSTANEVRDQEPGVGAKVKAEPEPSEPDRTAVALLVRAQYPDGVPRPCPSVDGSLQKKREYWKLMKRQQRARQKESQRKVGAGRGRGAGLGSKQAAALAPLNVAKTPARVSAALLRAPGNERLAAEPDSALPTLRPPQNPLSGLTLLLPVRPPAPLKRLWPPGAGPPKRRPEESEEDFVKRKREYWRIKKKEQRARKCVADKGVARGRTCTPPARKGFCQRAMPDEPLSDAEGHLVSNWADTGTCSHAAAAPPQGELLGTAERPPGEEGSVSQATWRNTYLMDYEPLDRLLVCVACGELQHSHSLEGVLAHIQEAHPHTRALEPAQRRRILEAWDEQVSRRERFFTSQLQRRHAALAESHRN